MEVDRGDSAARETVFGRQDGNILVLKKAFHDIVLLIEFPIEIQIEIIGHDGIIIAHAVVVIELLASGKKGDHEEHFVGTSASIGGQIDDDVLDFLILASLADPVIDRADRSSYVIAKGDRVPFPFIIFVPFVAQGDFAHEAIDMDIGEVPVFGVGIDPA